MFQSKHKKQNPYSIVLFSPWIFCSFQPWNTYVGDGYPGHMRSFTWNYVSGSRRAFNSSLSTLRKY